MSENRPDIWLLADDRAGNVNQALGVLEALGEPFERIDIGYSGWAKLPNIVRGASLIGLDSQSKDRLVTSRAWPKLVVSAGRRSAPILRWIKRQSGGRTKIVQIMRPDAGENDFDLIVVPAHDKVRSAENLYEIPAATHRVSAAKLSEEGAHWAATFANLPSPRIAVIVGGSTKKTQFTEEMARELASWVREIAETRGGSVLLTTSRRTGAAQSQILRDAVSHLPGHFFGWGQAGNNPYFGYLAHAEAVIVTGDSVSMVSEACAVPVPVHVYAPSDLIPVRHRRMHQNLFAQGLAHPFNGPVLASGKAEPLQTAEWVASEIQRRLFD